MQGKPLNNLKPYEHITENSKPTMADALWELHQLHLPQKYYGKFGKPHYYCNTCQTDTENITQHDEFGELYEHPNPCHVNQVLDDKSILY